MKNLVQIEIIKIWTLVLSLHSAPRKVSDVAVMSIVNSIRASPKTTKDVPGFLLMMLGENNQNLLHTRKTRIFQDFEKNCTNLWWCFTRISKQTPSWFVASNFVRWCFCRLIFFSAKKFLSPHILVTLSASRHFN